MLKRFERYYYWFRNIVLVLLFVSIYYKQRSSPGLMFAYMGGYLAALLNDQLRYNVLGFKSLKGAFSLGFSVIASCFLVMTDGSFYIYFYSILYEIIVFMKGRSRTCLLSINILSVISAFLIKALLKLGKNTGYIMTLSFWQSHIIDLVTIILLYVNFVFLFYYLDSRMEREREVKKLNNELRESYEKLKEYSAKNEELAAAKERNRIARDIHDTIGHSMTALIMNLDFIEKVIDINPQKAKELVIRAEDIARGAMADIRRAVYALRGEADTASLTSSIKSLVENLTAFNEKKVNMNISQDIESLSPVIKSTIYRVVQEGLTNGIKHGGADIFYLDITIVGEDMKLVLKDNGRGCAAIIKGSGLSGMEERINSLGGSIKFMSPESGGFIIELSVPLKGVLGNEAADC